LGGGQVVFDNKNIVDWSLVEIDVDNIAVSKESIWGYPKAILGALRV
jgi:hypothetical protein